MWAQVESLPDPSLGLRSLIATEIRGDGIGVFIKGVFPRNSDGQEQLMVNTCDPEKTNRRKMQIKRKIADLHFCALSTNVSAKNDAENEEYKTLTTVLHVMTPGSGPHTKRQRTGPFNNISCNPFGGRQSKPKRHEGISNLLAYSHVWATCGPALMNKAGVIPAEISPTVLGFLDWLFFYIKESTEGVLDKHVSESFKRMKDGYEARGVAKSLWTQSIMVLAQAKSQDEATLQIMQTMFSNAMPVFEVPAVAHSFLTRGIHMGSLMMVGCIAKHLNVPIINTDALRRFFDEPAAPTEGEGKHTCDLIRDWLLQCVHKNRFCPENAGQFHPVTNASVYITSDGDFEGNPTSDKDTMLRLKKSRVQDEVHHAIGSRIRELFGRMLTETCHMGPEASIYSNAIWDLLFQWNPDFRQLLSGRIFDSARHLRKLGLEGHLSGVQDWPAGGDRPPVFARTYQFVYNQETKAVGVGVHAFALLMCVSFTGGATLHPKVSSDFARSVLREILQHAPPAATPGNNSLVRSFNLHTTITERVIVPKAGRPAHFPRPIDDLHFITTGIFTYARAIGRFLPEDAMHCGSLFQFASLFKCDVMELPASEIHASYELMANTHYALWRAEDGAKGTLHVSSSVRARVGVEHFNWGFEEWPQRLREKGLLIVPMIWRQGACVRLTGDKVGCVVPAGGKNFDPDDCTYHVLVDRDETVSQDFTETLRSLIPVGTKAFLRLGSSAVQDLRLNLARGDRDKDLLCVRINVPTVENPEPGKVYVSCLQKPILARSDVNDVSSATYAVDPWDLALDKPASQEAVPSLVSGPAQ